MSDLWFFGNADPWGQGGFSGPDPVTQSSAGWTWELNFVTDSNQWTYARTSLNTFVLFEGDGWIGSGIVDYRTRGGDGVEQDHPVGQSDGNGFVDFINDFAVTSVTFGWTLEGDNYCRAQINMEVWVTG